MEGRASAFALLRLWLLVAGTSSAITEDDAHGRPPVGDVSAAVSGASDALAHAFDEVARDELGLDAVADLLSAARPAPPRPADEDLLLAFAERLSAKLTAAVDALADMKRAVANDSSIRSYSRPCPTAAPFKKLPTEESSERPDPILRIKRRHFMSASDDAADESCRPSAEDSRLRRLFQSAFRPQPKRVILALDNGKRANRNELRVVASIAIELIDALQETDSVGAVAAGGVAFEPRPLTAECPSDSEEDSEVVNNRELAVAFVGDLEPSDEVFDASAMRRAIDMIAPDGSDSTIVFIGKDFDWAFKLRNAENETGGKNASKIVINACVVSNEISPSDADEHRLPACEDGRPDQIFCEGIRVRFDSWTTAGRVASSLLSTLPRGNYEKEPKLASPVWDAIQKDLFVPFIMPCGSRGLVVLDLYLADIAQDIIYFDPLSQRRRSFLINFSGEVVMHSSYSRPEVLSAKPRPVDIALLETDPQFVDVKARMLNLTNGSHLIYNGTKITTYTWKWVKNFYIMGIASETDVGFSNTTETSKRIVSRMIRELQYHRIDLLPPIGSSRCRHFRQVSTIDRGTLYLSPSSFQSPFKYLFDLKSGNEMSLRTLLQSCMAYLKDPTRFLSNPGLKSEIRNDVGLLYPMLNYFKHQHIHGSYNKYIVRRYASTDHGVLVMFPGSILESDYEPNRKSWFSKALLNPGKIILTPPYLDVGGAGYIVTISYAPKEQSSNSKPVLVVSMDITMGFLYKMLADSLLICATPNIKCFIMDEQGYLLSHPSLFDKKGTGPIEQQHITHRESSIAIDMLSHKGLVEKKICKNFVDGTLQRYYNFNTSINGVLTNLIHGEHCSRYHITPIHGTNTFLGMVNISRDSWIFCPCSVTNRLCLNCNRMEQDACECPCECALPDSTCSASSPDAPMCDLQPERNNHKNNFFYNSAIHLKPCFDFQCDSYKAESSCIGVLGCEWCHLDVDAETPLSAPFCSAQSSCFGGVLGAVTPYGEGSQGHVIQDDLLASYSAVGPIAGCIVAVCLILAIAVYCYKQNSVSSVSDPYLGVTPETWPDPGVQMSHLASEDDIHDDRSGHQDKLLSNDLVVPISPYRVVTSYRRPNTTGESDHGYSTMTPHDDSEHLAFASMEPFMSRDASIVGDVADSPVTSMRTSITEPMTILSCGKNNVIAPVTVHRHMEAT